MPTLTYRKREATLDIILHDTHTVPGKLNIEHWLKVEGRRMGLLGIGFHYLVHEDGRLSQTRPHDTIGSHTTGFNRKSIGVALVGGRRVTPGPDGETILRTADTFTEDQRTTLRWLVGNLREQYGPLRVKGHTECGHHATHPEPCPALNMDDLRQALGGTP